MPSSTRRKEGATADLAPVIEAYEREAEPSFWASVAEGGLSVAERRAVELSQPPPGARMLVVGCGAGRESLALARMGFRVVGLDLSRVLVDAARAGTGGARSLTYLVGDATDLPFEDGSFDHVVMLSQMLGHIPRRRLRQRALSEAARVLRRDGVAVVSVYHRSFKDYPILYLVWRVLKRRRRSPRSEGGDTPNSTARGREASSPTDRLRDMAGNMWHARILRARLLARSLRFRLARAVRRPREPESPRDLYIHPHVYAVSFAPRPGLAFYHLYVRNEFLEDVRPSGLGVAQVHSFRELNAGDRLPPLIHELDFLMFYALRKT